MISNAKRGAYWKARSKCYLERQGFDVADMELVRTVFTPAGMMIPTKRDQFGSDLAFLAKDVVVFVQVKGGVKPSKTLIREAKRGFEPYRFPVCSRREVHIWRFRARHPEIVAC